MLRVLVLDLHSLALQPHAHVALSFPPHIIIDDAPHTPGDRPRASPRARAYARLRAVVVVVFVLFVLSVAELVLLVVIIVFVFVAPLLCVVRSRAATRAAVAQARTSLPLFT